MSCARNKYATFQIARRLILASVLSSAICYGGASSKLTTPAAKESTTTSGITCGLQDSTNGAYTTAAAIYILTDSSSLTGAINSANTGVHAPLGDHFPVKVCEFLDQPDVLQQGWAARASGLDIEIVADRRARRMSQVWGVGFRFIV